MEDKTATDVYTKIIECFNKTFEETHTIRKQNQWANEHIDHIHTNTRNTFRIVAEMQDEIQQLKLQIHYLKLKVDK